MSRRRVAEKREILPDPKYGDKILAKFINMLMRSGKKSVAEKIVYGALDEIGGKEKGDAIEIFTKALENVRPVLPIRFLLKFALTEALHWPCDGWWMLQSTGVRKTWDYGWQEN
jgi:ribosomal protein S7